MKGGIAGDIVPAAAQPLMIDATVQSEQTDRPPSSRVGIDGRSTGRPFTSAFTAARRHVSPGLSALLRVGRPGTGLGLHGLMQPAPASTPDIVPDGEQWERLTPTCMRRLACIPVWPAGPRSTFHPHSPRCDKVRRRLLCPATFPRFWDTGRTCRPSSFMGTKTTQCIRVTATMSLRREELRSCKRKYIAVGHREDMLIPAPSIPTRAGG